MKDRHLLLPGSLVSRLFLWALIFAVFPLSVTAARLSFRTEVLGCIPSVPVSAPLAERVQDYLARAEKKESDPWLRDDVRIAWITTLYTSRGNSQPHIDATYQVLGLHPDKVWPAILARRAALLGRFHDIPQQKKPMAESRDGNAPQKTCAYGADINSKLAGTVDPKRLASTASRVDITGTSWSTETKREARRALTSEFGHDGTPAGVPAPAVLSPTPQLTEAASV